MDAELAPSKRPGPAGAPRRALASVTSGRPRKGEPVLVGQGMQIDRAQLVLSDPTEISTFIKRECP